MPLYLNDKSQDAPKLRVFLNLANLTGLPPSSSWPGLTGGAAWEKLAADGFEGVQLIDAPGEQVPAGLPFCGLGRVDDPADADGLFARHKERGDRCITLHVGWGIEDDSVVDELTSAVLEASLRHRLPAFLETHRATVTQDLWRTVQLVGRFPDLLINADYSHYYCGQELVYGGCERKWAFMQPIFDRTGFMHGRIASPGCMQVPVENPSDRPRMAVGAADYLADFREMWIRAMMGFLNAAGPGDVLIFAPEILAPDIYYARVFPGPDGGLQEESDRYAQALIYSRIARECFLAAQNRAKADVRD